MNARILIFFFVFAAGPLARAADDRQPVPFLAALEGRWNGELRYRSYGADDQFLTLPTKLAVSLTGPDEIALHLYYGEGVGKPVHAYTRMQFDLVKKELRWSGPTPEDNYRGTITEQSEEGGVTKLTVTREADENGKKTFFRYHLEFSADRLLMAKDDGDSPETLAFRNQYKLSRGP